MKHKSCWRNWFTRLLPLIVIGCPLVQSVAAKGQRSEKKKPPLPKWLAGHSAKKGIALGSGVGGRTWLQTIQLLHARWVYTWACHPPSQLPPHVHFIPMVWGHPSGVSADIKWLTRQHRKNAYSYLLTFNEPDNSTQSNLSVHTALKLWPKLESTGMVLGSPACVHPDGPWMMQFMRDAAQLHDRVNFVCVHWYGPPDPIAFLQLIYKTYALYHRPIWITEFAPADWGASHQHPNQYSEITVARFMRMVLPALNRLRFVQCYAWYPYGGVSRFTALGCSGLFHKNGKLTLLGRLYAEY